MRKLWETGILLFAVAGFWGMIYPDLCFISDVCRVEDVSEDAYGQIGEGESEERQRGREDISLGMGNGGEMEGNNEDAGKESDIYTRICEAAPGQIRVKSKLLELLINQKN